MCAPLKLEVNIEKMKTQGKFYPDKNILAWTYYEELN